ncbi:MAG: phosphoesterase, partial [Steroidobacteraceae bacterium]
MSTDVLEREICGETVLLHPERALSWPARRLLVVADTHFGKSSIFARHGIAVPAGADALDRERIDALLQATRSERLLVLGDFLHGPVA